MALANEAALRSRRVSLRCHIELAEESLCRTFMRIPLGLVLLALHSLGVFVIWCGSSNDASGCFAGIEWLPVAIADLPVALAMEAMEVNVSGNRLAAMFLVAGGVQWFLIGVVVQLTFGWIVGGRR